MQPEEVFQAAKARALHLEVPRPPEDSAIERLRTDCAALFDRVPEPPVYRRVDDPARKRAEELLPQGQELLAHCYALQRDEQAAPRIGPLIDALRAHLEALCHTADGRLEAAELAWRAGLELEAKANATRRVWFRTDEVRRPVFDRATRTSRFDPSPEPMLTVKLVCPNHACEQTDSYSLAPTYATHRFVCRHCHRPFVGYFAEARGVEARLLPGGKRYLFRVEEIAGGMSKVEFDEASGADFMVARRDLLAFLYSPNRRLEGVLNLSSGRLLWVKRGGPCFVATAAFGEDAPELAAFRAFRDEVLIRSPLGAAWVRGYYRWGPGAARFLEQWPLARAAVRGMLRRMHRGLSARGFA